MAILTNIRLMELRTTGLDCQAKVARGGSCNMGGPTILEEDYADLFQLVVDGKARLEEPDEYRTKTSLSFLLGK